MGLVRLCSRTEGLGDLGETATETHREDKPGMAVTLLPHPAQVHTRVHTCTHTYTHTSLHSRLDCTSSPI